MNANSTPVLLRALRLACERHAGQNKPRQKRSIIDHCVEVALLVSEAGLPHEAVVAAVLHDTLEKTPTTPEELEARFGPGVCLLVEAVTDRPGESKEAIHARLKAAPPEAQSIKCADIVSNLEALAVAGELNHDDIEKKAATLAVLDRAEPTLVRRAVKLVSRDSSATG